MRDFELDFHLVKIDIFLLCYCWLNVLSYQAREPGELFDRSYDPWNSVLDIHICGHCMGLTEWDKSASNSMCRLVPVLKVCWYVSFPVPRVGKCWLMVCWYQLHSDAGEVA